MKKHPLILLFIASLLLTSFNLIAQSGFLDHIVTTEDDGISSICSADIDGDGDIDLISVSWNDEILGWYKNNGFGVFGEKTAIYTSTDGYIPSSVYTIDVDGDGDKDLIANLANESGGQLVWFENEDGLGNFSDEKTIPSYEEYTQLIHVTDVDSDGDNDFIYSSSDGDHNYFGWYKNTDGLGNFSNIYIDHYPVWSRFVFTADFDGDGDQDILSSTHYLSNHTKWYENTDGLGNFDVSHFISAEYRISSATATDIDNDGDLDVVIAGGDIIGWYENIEGLVNFTVLNIITTEIYAAKKITTADLDGDGDIDIISASYGDDKIAWYKNDGFGVFGEQLIITTNADGAISVLANHINEDEHIDLISASSWDDKIVWYENLGTLDINMFQKDKFSFQPNPTEGIITITFDFNINNIEIHNSLGQLVNFKLNNNKIDLSHLNNGVYLIKIKDEYGNIYNSKIMKK